MLVVVDNTAGADERFAREVYDRLGGEGLDAELREPDGSAMFDTGVHLVTAGVVIRVPSAPDAVQLAAIERAVRAALEHRPSLRRRTRAVPVHLGETDRALAWIDPVE